MLSKYLQIQDTFLFDLCHTKHQIEIFGAIYCSVISMKAKVLVLTLLFWHPHLNEVFYSELFPGWMRKGEMHTLHAWACLPALGRSVEMGSADGRFENQHNSLSDGCLPIGNPCRWAATFLPPRLADDCLSSAWKPLVLWTCSISSVWINYWTEQWRNPPFLIWQDQNHVTGWWYLTPKDVSVKQAKHTSMVGRLFLGLTGAAKTFFTSSPIRHPLWIQCKYVFFPPSFLNYTNKFEYKYVRGNPPDYFWVQWFNFLEKLYMVTAPSCF